MQKQSKALRNTLLPAALVAGAVGVGLALSTNAAATPAPQSVVNSVPQFYEPFIVEVAGGLANSAGVGSANPEIIIDSNAGTGNFIVNSIMLSPDLPSSGFVALSMNYVEIDGTRYGTGSPNLVGPIQTSYDSGVDLMGTPIRTSGLTSTLEPGGCFPHQITADAAGAEDINVQLFARSDDVDMPISNVRVTGWKRPGETISVTYVPGN